MKGRLITIDDTLFYVLGTQTVPSTNEKGVEYWKRCWGADNVLKNGEQYYFVRTVINAEFDDI